MIAVPPGLAAQRDLGPEWAEWLDGLPRLHGQMLERWLLTPDGPPRHGYCSLVVPVRSADGVPAVLKLGLPDQESEHEHLALDLWAGHGAVRLLRADPRRRALLLERLHARDLSSLGYLEAAEVVAASYGSLHVPAPARLRTLTSYVERWAAALAALPADGPVPRRLVVEALALARDLVADGRSTGTVVHGDLHDHNVLAGDRAPWLVVDPKPMSGDPHYEPAPMLWNRWADAVAGGRVGQRVRERFHTLVDLAGLDEDRARAWVVVRVVLNAHWTVVAAERARRPLDARDRDWITRCVTVAKAVHRA